MMKPPIIPKFKPRTEPSFHMSSKQSRSTIYPWLRRLPVHLGIMVTEGCIIPYVHI